MTEALRAALREARETIEVLRQWDDEGLALTDMHAKMMRAVIAKIDALLAQAEAAQPTRDDFAPEDMAIMRKALVYYSNATDVPAHNRRQAYAMFQVLRQEVANPLTATQAAQPVAPSDDIRAQVEIMIASSTVLVAEDGAVTGYQVKTGALHKLFGILGCSVPLGLPEIGPNTLHDAAEALLRELKRQDNYDEQDPGRPTCAKERNALHAALAAQSLPPAPVQPAQEYPPLSLPSAAEWLSESKSAASSDWRMGWDAARNRLATLQDRAQRQAAQPAPVSTEDRALIEDVLGGIERAIAAQPEPTNGEKR